MDTRARRQLDSSIWTTPAHPGSLTLLLTLLCSHSLYLPSPFKLNPKVISGPWQKQGNQGHRVNSALKSNQPHTQTNTPRHTGSTHGSLICQGVHMLHIHTQINKARKDTGNTARHILYLLCQDVRMLNMHTRAHSH